MKVSPILNPLQGERVVGVDPEVALFPQADWRRRLHNYSGRTLTHRALIAEQRWRDGRLRSMGGLLAPGIVKGLEISHRDLPADTTGGGDTIQTLAQLHLSSGQAISNHGELITVTRPTDLMLDDVPVYNYARHIEQSSGEAPTTNAYAEDLPSLSEELNSSETLDDMTRLGILVLQPLFAEVNVDEDTGPCERDPSEYAYENWQLLDASRLVLCTWPEAWIPQPAIDDQWRNRVAHSIFAKERELSAGEMHPWQSYGIAIAAVGFTETWRVAFIDRNAVTRRGSGEPLGTDILQQEGNTYLWQAQFQQFNEQIAQRLKNLADQEEPPAVARGLFRFLPPVGILPKNFAAPREQNQEFFPVNYRCDARAIPYQQLDVILRESMPLLPFDLQVPDQVEILVPVQQNQFEARLLHVETLDVVFDETVQRFTRARDQWLGRRLYVRRRAAAIFEAIYGREPEFPSPDPDRIDNLELAAPYESAVIETGQVWRYLPGSSAPSSNWNQPGIDLSAWQSGATGFGYGEVEFETELADMRGAYVSLYCRKDFILDDDTLLHQLTLSIASSGGYTVYLNGSQVHQHNITSTAFNALATRPMKMLPLTQSLENFRSVLVSGTNTLAIAVHNHDRNASSFLFSARLLSTAALANYADFEIDEEDYDVDLAETSGSNFTPAYQVEKIETLRAYLADNAPPLGSDDLSALDEKGLEEYIVFLKGKIDQANDKVDFGFIRLQTDIYRVRQFVLGNTEGTKLATSPILASIAKGETAFSTKQELSNFVKNLSQGGAAGTPLSTPPTDGGGGGGEISAPATPVVASASSSIGDTFISGDLLGAASPTLSLSSESLIRNADLSGIRGAGEFIVRDSSPDNLVLARESGLLTQSTEARRGLLFASQSGSVEAIQEQNAIIGSTSQYRNVTVAERLEEPIATATKVTGVATKAEVLQDIVNVGINVDDIEVPGFRDDAGVEVNRSFGDIVSGNLIAEVLNGDHDANARDAAGEELTDEAAYFNAGVRSLENAAVVLRKVEGRVHAYKRVRKRCEEVLANLKKDLKKTDLRLKEIETELAEARHDLSVARALREEELERINAINARRDEILANYVPFLLFRRPRFTDTHREAPVHFLNPHVKPSDKPECDIDESDIPEEISVIIDLVRDAPARWFVIADKVLSKLSRLEDLQTVVKDSHQRAKKTKPAKSRYLSKTGKSKYEQAINSVYADMYKKISDEKDKLAKLKIAGYLQLGWQETRVKVKEIVSISDVIDSNHGRMGANKIAAEELKDIVEVLTCLYQFFDSVLPAIRLDWAERLSQFDESISLRKLSSLPRWSEIPFLDRQAMQPLVDWLYGRFSSAYIDAVLMVDDLVRMCLLLASHSPVDKIVAGQLEKNVKAEAGKTFEVAVSDTRKVDIGMAVLVQSEGKTHTEAVVEDISDGKVKAKVIKTKEKGMRLEEKTSVQITKKATSRKKPRKARAKKTKSSKVSQDTFSQKKISQKSAKRQQQRSGQRILRLL